jgi:phosphotriesterase-related protein
VRRGCNLVAAIAAALLVGGISAPNGNAVAVSSEARIYARLLSSAREARLVGKVQTVQGVLAPDALGYTLMHEHLFIDFFPEFAWPARPDDMPAALFLQMQETGWTIPTTAAEREFFARRELTLSMVNDLRRGLRARTNVVIDDEREVADEIARYRAVGGHTIVDVTPIGLGRDPARLQRFSRQHDLTIVMGTGWYRWPFHPSEVHELSIAALAERMVSDILRGDRTHQIKAGIIGEIPLDSRSIRLPGQGAAAMSNDAIKLRIGAAERRLEQLGVAERDRVPLADIYDEQEIKVLRAAARAARLSGASLMLHAREPWLGFLGMLREEGVDPRRIVIGHAHPHFMDRELLVHALRSGVVLEADYMLQQYATRAPLGPLHPILDGVAWAIRNGHRDQVLLSLDLCNKLGQQRYGGGGYTTLQDYVFPYLRAHGVSDADIHHVMVENPKRLLTFIAPQAVLRP